ncbi:alpha-2,3-sialyltransferase [Campylobacter jejuni]|nr:alpha-2,3-sialyltransferase [Campylobacter jejuni]
MKPEYWDKIAEFIADIIKTKNENILNLNQTLEIKNQELSNQTNQIHNLNTTLENKNQLLTAKENLLNFQNNYGKAKARIQNQLSYKLGQALILNSKSVLGYLSLPFIILSIVISHKQKQKAYKFKVKKNPNLALPPLETYPDYNEALKEKECFTYKLGEEFIKASKNWYGGGYIKFILKDVPRLKKEINQERK